ncbi:MAG: hypothetical protein V9G23_03295 [Giesbergeria sp.]
MRETLAVRLLQQGLLLGFVDGSTAAPARPTSTPMAGAHGAETAIA